MFTQLAQVFSSQGVILPGPTYVPRSGRSQTEAACDHKNECSCFAPKFEQASTKLELSKLALKQLGDTATSKEEEKVSGAKEDPALDERTLSAEEQKQVEELAKRDREVKAHEAAHKASAGGTAEGGANYEYQTGPDGRQYAVGGHVNISAAPAQGNPDATLQKARTIQRAALAPADPSGQDRAVAAAASQMAMEAQQEKAVKARSNSSETKDSSSKDPRRAYSREPSMLGAALSVVG